MTDYLSNIIKQFEYYKLLGEKTFNQLTEEQLFWKENEECNSIANIVQHLSGNMISRWTDFLESDGEKEWRNREAEFEDVIRTKTEMITIWNTGWSCLFNALSTIKDDDFNKIVYIRNQGHTVVEAINRQLAHYPYHVGQIVFIGKLLAGSKWESLSIPRGSSIKYNDEKFSKPKEKGHFTDEFLSK